MAEAKAPNTKSIIIGLLNIKNTRTLAGENAIFKWMTESIEVLLRAELERLEKKEKDHA